MSVSIYNTGSKPKRKTAPKPVTEIPATGRRVKRHVEATPTNGSGPGKAPKTKKTARTLKATAPVMAPKPATMTKPKKSTGPSPTAKRRVIPPATRAKHRVTSTARKSATFSLEAPSSLDVAIAGSFNDWERQAMTKEPDGLWRITVQAPPGTHQYRFFVDTYWREDPNNPRKVQNHMGGFNSVCDVM